MRILQITILLALLLVVVSLAFSPCLQGGFLNWDDSQYVTNNPVIQHLSFYNFKQIFLKPFVGTYLPLTMLSYVVDYQCYKLDPFGYHLSNLVFHLLNCLLAFCLVRLLTRNFFVAFMAAMFFGIHPLRVESVAWVSERKDVLCAFFFLLALISYHYHVHKPRTGKFFYLTIFLFLCALLSKAMAVTLPLILFLQDYFYGRKVDRRMFLEKIPFFIFSIGFGVGGILAQGAAVRIEPFMTVFDKILVASYAIVFYLAKTVYPVDLSCMYPYFGVMDFQVLGSTFSIFLFFLLWVIISIRFTKKILWGGLFFLVVLLPVLQWVPMGSTIVADRYTYMASLGLAYLAAELVLWTYKKLAILNRAGSFLVVALIGILAVSSLSVLTWRRCRVWQDSVAVMTDALGKYPDLVLAYNQRGLAYWDKKDHARALDDFENQIRYLPGDPLGYMNLGGLYSATGRIKEAIAVFEKVDRLKNKRTGAEAQFALATMYAQIGQDDKAIDAFKKALVIDPQHSAAYFSLGMLYKKIGNKDEAARTLSRSVEMAPDFLFHYPALSMIFEETGKKAEQLSLYRQAIAHEVPFYDAYYDIGNLDLERGDVKSAIRMFKKAVEINPSSAEAYVSLGSAYCSLGQSKKAIPLLTKALEMNPKIAVAYNNIAFAYFMAKKYDLAIQHCDKATELGYKVSEKFLESLKPYRK